MDKEIRDAIEYNRRHLSSANIHSVQEIVGTLVDGIIGPNTVAAIMKWQEEHGLEDDGKVGSVTFSRMIKEHGAQQEVVDLDYDEKLEVMRPTMEHESGSNAYSATNEDWMPGARASIE